MKSSSRRTIPLVGMSFYDVETPDSETDRLVLGPSYDFKETKTVQTKPKISLKARVLKTCITKATLLQFPKTIEEERPMKLVFATERDTSVISSKSLSRSFEYHRPHSRHRETREIVRPSSQYSPYRIAQLNLNCKVPTSLFAPSPKVTDKRRSSPYIGRSCFTPQTSRLRQRKPAKLTRMSTRASLEQVSGMKLVYSCSSNLQA